MRSNVIAGVASCGDRRAAQCGAITIGSGRTDSAHATPTTSSAMPASVAPARPLAAQREGVSERGERLEHDELPGERGRQPLARLVPAQRAEPRGEEPDREHQRDEAERRGPERQRERGAGRGARDLEHGESGQRERQCRDALRRAQCADSVPRMRAQPVGIPDRIPRPAGDGAQRQQRAEAVTHRIDVADRAHAREAPPG